MSTMTVYALNASGIAYGDDEGVLEYPSEAEAMDAFRHYVRTHHGSRRYENLWEMYLFPTREDAEQANESTDDEVQINEAKALHRLAYERGYGFNF